MAIKYGDEEVEKDTADEKAIRWLLESVVMRRKGELQKAKELLVMVVEKQTPAQAPFDMWMGMYSFPPPYLMLILMTKQLQLRTMN